MAMKTAARQAVIGAVIGAGLGLAAGAAQAAGTTIPMTMIDDHGKGKSIGSVHAQDVDGGVTLTPDLHGLPPGQHGMHVHEKPSCKPEKKDGKMTAGVAAGEHWDPAHTGKHLGPNGGGHEGDLPVLEVGPDGTARTPVEVPSLKVAELKGHSLMIHQGGDNFSDQPLPNGGGGGRIACGVIKGGR